MIRGRRPDRETLEGGYEETIGGGGGKGKSWGGVRESYWAGTGKLLGGIRRSHGAMGGGG